MPVPTRVLPSISAKHASEESQEEYSDNDGLIYHRENVSRHGHRDRDAYFPDDMMGEEGDQQPCMFRAAAQTDARNFFKGAHELTFPSYAFGARWLEETTANALVQGQVIPKLQFNHNSRNSWDSIRDKPLGYYVVGATNAGNNTTMLRLAHEYGGTAYLPPIIFIEYRAEDHRILVAHGKISAEGTHEKRKNYANVAIQPAREWRSRCVDARKINGRGERQRRV
jgi:hypothetical protein